MLKINFTTYLFIAIYVLFIFSCDNDPCEDVSVPVGFVCEDGRITCNTTCEAGEVLAVDCRCITDAASLTPDPCVDETCPEGFVKEAQTCNCIEIMPSTTTIIELNAGFLSSNLDAFGAVDLGDFTVPSSYDIEGALAPGAYNGQKRRAAQLKEIVAVTQDEPITFDIAAALINENRDQFTTEAAMGDSDIRTKIDELNFDNGNTAVADAFGDLAERLVASSQNFAITASNGVAGMITTGSKRRHVSANGLEYAQILEKGLYGPLFYDQMVDDYLRLSQAGPDNSNGNNESSTDSYGSNGTDRQHRWDEAFGYLVANPMTYPNPDNTASGDGDFMANYIFDFSDETEEAYGIHLAQRIMDAFILGRAVLKAGEGFGPGDENVNEAALEACRQDIKLYVEAGLATAAFHYLNNAIVDITEEDKLHHLSEAYGFIYSLSFNSEGRLSEAEAYDVLEELGWPKDNHTLSGIYDINLWEITDEQIEAARVKLNSSFPGFINISF